MDAAEERSKAAAQVLAPPPDPNAPPGAPASTTGEQPADGEPQAATRKPEQ